MNNDDEKTEFVDVEDTQEVPYEYDSSVADPEVSDDDVDVPCEDHRFFPRRRARFVRGWRDDFADNSSHSCTGEEETRL